jgi:hypothetical protein
MNWKKNMVSPPQSRAFRSIDVRTSGSRPAATTLSSQAKNSQTIASPARISHNVGDTPSHDGPSGFGWTQPHSPDRRTPKTARPRPVADSTTPIRSRRKRPSGGASCILRVSARMPSTITTSPAKTSRQVQYVVTRPPINGPAATAIAPAEATRP